nr:hypothetical protein [Tanacetum cinerariifolium]
MSPPSNLNPNPSQSCQRFSPLNPLDLKDDQFESLFGEGPSRPVEEESPDKSPVEEVAPVKRKNKSGYIYQAVEKSMCVLSCDFPNCECYNILEEHKKWKTVEYPKYLSTNYNGNKNSRTSKNTSNGTSESTHIGLDMNDEAADSRD